MSRFHFDQARALPPNTYYSLIFFVFRVYHCRQLTSVHKDKNLCLHSDRLGEFCVDLVGASHVSSLSRPLGKSSLVCALPENNLLAFPGNTTYGYPFVAFVAVASFPHPTAPRAPNIICAHSLPLHMILSCKQNMVGPGEVDDDLEGETQGECERFGPVRRCLIYELKVGSERKHNTPLSICLFFTCFFYERTSICRLPPPPPPTAGICFEC